MAGNYVSHCSLTLQYVESHIREICNMQQTNWQVSNSEWFEGKLDSGYLLLLTNELKSKWIIQCSQTANWFTAKKNSCTFTYPSYLFCKVKMIFSQRKDTSYQLDCFIETIIEKLPFEKCIESPQYGNYKTIQS